MWVGFKCKVQNILKQHRNYILVTILFYGAFIQLATYCMHILTLAQKVLD